MRFRAVRKKIAKVPGFALFAPMFDQAAHITCNRVQILLGKVPEGSAIGFLGIKIKSKKKSQSTDPIFSRLGTGTILYFFVMPPHAVNTVKYRDDPDITDWMYLGRGWVVGS